MKAVIDKVRKWLKNAAIIPYAWILKQRKHSNTQKNANKRILIVIMGALGDFILFSSILDDLYSELNQRHVIVEFAMAPSVIQLFDNYCNKRIANVRRYALPIFTPDSSGVKAFQQSYKHLEGKHYDTVISSGYSTKLGLLLTTVDANKIIVMQQNTITQNPIKRYYRSKVATEVLAAAPNKQLLYRHAELMEYLFHKPYDAKLPHFGIQTKARTIQEPYCIIAAGAGEGGTYASFKRWDENKFAVLADHIQEKWCISVVFTGAPNEMQISRRIIDLMHCHETCLDVTGQTSITEWIDLVSQAVCVIGNDSGIIHLASALGVPNICIGGYWEYGKWFPYPEGNRSRSNYLPRHILSRDIPACRGCFFSEGRWSLNSKCQKEVKRGNACICLQKIETEAVFHEVDVLMEMQQEKRL